MTAKLLLMLSLIAVASCGLCRNRTEWTDNVWSCDTGNSDVNTYRLDQCTKMKDGTYSIISSTFSDSRFPSGWYEQQNFGWDSTCGKRFSATAFAPENCFYLNFYGKFIGDTFQCPGDIEQPQPTSAVPAGATWCVTQDKYTEPGCGGISTTQEIPCGACNPDKQQILKCDVIKGNVEVIQFASFDTTCQGARIDVSKFRAGDCFNLGYKFRPIAYCSAAGTPWAVTTAPTIADPCITVQSGFADTITCTTPSDTSFIQCGGKCSFVSSLKTYVKAHCNDVTNKVNLKLFYDHECKVLKDDQKLNQKECYNSIMLTDFLSCPTLPPPPPAPTAMDFTNMCAVTKRFIDSTCTLPSLEPNTKSYTCGQITTSLYGDIKVNCYNTPDTSIVIQEMSGTTVTNTKPSMYKSQCVDGEQFVGFESCA